MPEPIRPGTHDSTSKTSWIFLHCEQASFRIQQTLTHHLFFTWKICKFSYLFLQRMKRGLPEEIGFRSFFTQLNSRTFFPSVASYNSTMERCNCDQIKHILSWPSLPCLIVTPSKQIYLVMLRPTQLTQASFLQKKKSNVAKCVFDICNAEMAQWCQKSWHSK